MLSARKKPLVPHLAMLALSSSHPTKTFSLRKEVSALKGTTMCRGMTSSFPDLDPRDILTQEGESRVARMFHTHACVAAATTLFTGADLLKFVWVGGSDVWEDDGDEDDTFVMRWQIIILKAGRGKIGMEVGRHVHGAPRPTSSTDRGEMN